MLGSLTVVKSQAKRANQSPAGEFHWIMSAFCIVSGGCLTECLQNVAPILQDDQAQPTCTWPPVVAALYAAALWK
jgi:hypothetical protein